MTPPLPGVLLLPGGLTIDTFRLFVVLGAAVAARVYTRLWRRAAADASAANHLFLAGLGAYAGARVVSLAAAGTVPGSVWDWIGFAELTLSWVGAGIGALAGAAAAAHRAGHSPRAALDAAACALAAGLAVGAWGAVPAVYVGPIGLAAAAAGWIGYRDAPGSGRALAAVLLVIGLGRSAVGLFAGGTAGSAAGALLTPTLLGDLLWAAAGAVLAVRSGLRPGPVMGSLILAVILIVGGLTLQTAWPGAVRSGEAAGAAPPAGRGDGTPATTAEAPAAPVVGFRAPDFEAPTLDGDVFSIAAQRGRPVMLNFWATWCPPCRAEMPEIHRIHQDYGDRVAVVGVNVNEPSDVVGTFVEAGGFGWTFVLDRGSKVAALYRLRPIPTTFFIDGGGVIRHIEYGAMTESAIRAVLERLLRESDAG